MECASNDDRGKGFTGTGISSTIAGGRIPGTMRFSDRVAIVTGSARGIGAARARSPRVAVVLGAALLLGGCGWTSLRGETALSLGRYDEAPVYVEHALVESPDSAEARFGLGLARYRLGALDDAAAVLTRAVQEAPRRLDVRLYLALVQIQRRQDELAREQLSALLGLDPHPRLAAQVRRTLGVLDPALSDPLRDLIRASLEDELAWQQDELAARWAPRAGTPPPWWTSPEPASRIRPPR